MSNWSTTKLILTIVFVVAGTALAGFWQSSSAQQWLNNEQVIKKLELSDETVQALRQKRSETQQQVAELHGQLRAARLKLKELLGQEKPDKAEVDKTIEKISDLQTQIHKVRADHLLFAKGQLTPEQQQKIKKMINRRIRAKLSEARQRPEGVYGPIRERQRLRDRDCLIQGLDQPQRVRSRISRPGLETEQPPVGVEPAFAPRGAQSRAGRLARQHALEAPFSRGPAPAVSGQPPVAPYLP